MWVKILKEGDNRYWELDISKPYNIEPTKIEAWDKTLTGSLRIVRGEFTSLSDCIGLYEDDVLEIQYIIDTYLFNKQFNSYIME